MNAEDHVEFNFEQQTQAVLLRDTLLLYLISLAPTEMPAEHGMVPPLNFRR